MLLLRRLARPLRRPSAVLKTEDATVLMWDILGERQQSQTITLRRFVVAAFLSVFPLSLTAQMWMIHNPPTLLGDFHSQPVWTCRGPLLKLAQAKITHVRPFQTKKEVT